MIVLTWAPERGRTIRKVIVLGAGGQVGSAIVAALARGGCLAGRPAPVDWHDRRQVRRQLADLQAGMEISSNGRLDWVWAAGKAGFAATPAEVGDEMRLFRDFLDVVCAGRAAGPSDAVVRLHLVSSAGGLFEGRRHVGPLTAPRPRRPYGELKLVQENAARKRFGSEGLYIYRLSSVYGLIRAGRRAGLISVLIGNTLRHRTTLFNGHLDTLRDYVWAGDVGAFIAEQIGSDETNRPITALLASGRPASIFEIRDLVQRATRQRTLVHCLADMSNAAHTSFAPAALPGGWRTSALEINIRRIVADALCTGRLMPMGQEADAR